MSNATESKYTIYTTPENEVAMVQAIRDLKIEGTMWPNRDEPRFDLKVSEDTLLLLKLRIPFVRHNVS